MATRRITVQSTARRVGNVIRVETKVNNNGKTTTKSTTIRPR